MINNELLAEAAKVCQDKAALLPDISQIQNKAEDVCPVAWAQQIVDIAYQNNCGRSIPCRDGLWQLKAIMDAITSGSGSGEDLDLLADILDYMNKVGCEFVKKAAALVAESLRLYADEWDKHARMKRCSALQCPAYYAVYIDPSLCVGCGTCVKNAPQGAIEGAAGKISMVRDDTALKGDFAAVCPKGAIKRYSPSGVKPRVPETLTDVGAFEAAGSRRRRRG